MPERTCVCCRKKGEKKQFYRIAEENNKNVWDKKYNIQSRGFYICKDTTCIERLSKHKKYKIEITELIKILEQLKKEKKNIIDIIRPMKNSNYFVFGVDENMSAIKKDKVKLLIIPKDIKEKYIETFINLEKEYKFKIVFIEKKVELIELFSRDVNIVGIFDKKVVNGILNKVEVTDENL